MSKIKNKLFKFKIHNILYIFITLILWVTAFFVSFNIFKAHINKPKLVSTKTDEYISKAMKICKDEGSKTSCYKKNAIDFLNHFTLPEILEVFQKNEKKPEFFSNCHMTSHFLGQEMYKRVRNIQKVISQASEACLGGTYHGAVEGYFMANNSVIVDGNDSFVTSEIPKLCGNISEYKIEQEYYNCHHGLGHALMYTTENDLIKALKLCDYLQNEGLKALCYSGAFMENATGGNSQDHPSKYFKEEDPIYPCQILEKRYQNICYTYYVLSKFQDDTKKSINLCSTIPKDFRTGCFETYGRDRTMISSEPKILLSQCAEITNQSWRNSCIEGLSYNLIVRFGHASPLGMQFCNLVENDLKANCYKKLGQAMRFQIQDENDRQKFCNRAPEDTNKLACRGK